MLAALALAAAGWLLYAQWWGRGNERPVAWRDLTPRLGRVEFTRKVTGTYRSRAALAKLLDATMPGRAPKPPPLDWLRDEVVVIALGPRSSTGYALRVRRVVEHRREVVVDAYEQTPSLGDPVVPRVTYPYRMLAIPRTGKPVSVKLRGRP